MKIRESIQAAKELPNQMKMTVQLALVALAFSVAAFFLMLGVSFRAH